MAVTVNINGLSCIHQASGGTAVATLPDVCKTAPSGQPVPYPNIALSSDLVLGTATVSVDGSSAAVQGSMFVKSTGDEPGAAGGVISQVAMMEATFLSFSPTVFFEGQPACRLTDKMLMNKGNTVCMSGELQSVVVDPSSMPPEAVEPPPPEEPVFCEVTELTIGCNHGARAYMPDLMSQDVPVLQIISTDKDPDKLLVRPVSTCGFGHAYCPSILISPQGSVEWNPVAPAGVVLPPRSDFHAVAAFERLIYGEWPHEAYSVWPMICNGAGKAEVPLGVWAAIEVYNEMAFKAKVSLAWSHPEVNAKQPVFVYKAAQAFKISGSMEGKVGRHSYKLESEKKTPAGVKFPFIGALADKLGKSIFIADMFCKFGDDLKGSIKWPDVKFNGALELAELVGKPLVGVKGSFSLVCDPLIGFELKVSLLNLLLRYGAPLLGPGAAGVANLLLEVKKRFTSDPKKLEMEIDLTISGDIKGSVGGVYTDGNLALDGTSTNIEGGIGLQIEGRVQGTAKIMMVEMAGGIKAGLGGAKGEEPSRIASKLVPVVSNKSIRLTGEVYFTGMAFYYLLYGEVGMTLAESEKKDPKAPKPKTKGGAKNEPIDPEHKTRTADRYDRKGTYVLMDAWTWKYSVGELYSFEKEAAAEQAGAGGAPAMGAGEGL